MENKDSYTTEIYGINNLCFKVECPAYFERLVYKPPDLSNMTEVQKNKYEKLKLMCDKWK